MPSGILQVGIFIVWYTVDMNTVYLGLGSNLGEKQKNIETALGSIDETIGEIEVVSSLFQTAPVGFEDQPDFVNGVCKLHTSLDVHGVLEKVEIIMKDMGRIRTFTNGPRIIDIDILLFDDQVIESELLTVPHPRMLERMFVLEPLNEIGGEVVHPLTHKTIREHYEELKVKG